MHLKLNFCETAKKLEKLSDLPASPETPFMTISLSNILFSPITISVLLSTCLFLLKNVTCILNLSIVSRYLKSTYGWKHSDIKAVFSISKISLLDLQTFYFWPISVIMSFFCSLFVLKLKRYSQIFYRRGSLHP